MQLFLHLYSQINGRVCFNNEYCTILKEQTKTKVKVNFERAFYLEFTPIDASSYASFLCEIKYKFNTLQTNCQNVHIIKLDEANYYIVINCAKQNKVNVLNNNEQELMLKNKRIVYNMGKLEIFDKNKYNTITITKNTARQFALSEQCGLIILFCNDNAKNNLHIINNNFKHIVETTNRYQIKNNEVQCIKYLKTFAKHMRIVCYDVSTLERTKSYVAYPVKPKIENLPKIVLPYAFMQCLQVEDYALAQSFLDGAIFVGKINKLKVNNFFGNYYLVCTPQIKKADNTICLLYKNNNTIDCKYYTFHFNSDNKITNITPA